MSKVLGRFGQCMNNFIIAQNADVVHRKRKILKKRRADIVKTFGVLQDAVGRDAAGELYRPGERLELPALFLKLRDPYKSLGDGHVKPFERDRGVRPRERKTNFEHLGVYLVDALARRAVVQRERGMTKKRVYRHGHQNCKNMRTTGASCRPRRFQVRSRLSSKNFTMSSSVATESGRVGSITS